MLHNDFRIGTSAKPDILTLFKIQGPNSKFERWKDTFSAKRMAIWPENAILGNHIMFFLRNRTFICIIIKLGFYYPTTSVRVPVRTSMCSCMYTVVRIVQ